MGKQCIVSGCYSKQGKSIFLFPSKRSFPELHEAWRKCVPDEYSKIPPGSFNNFGICELHFQGRIWSRKKEDGSKCIN